MTVTVTMTAAGTAVAPVITSQGATTPDFVLASGGTCAATPYSVGSQCTVSVVFQPQHAGLRTGAVEITDGNGHLLGEALVDGVGSGSLAVLKPGIINTIAGNGYWLYSGDNMPATQTAVFLPNAVTEDAAGNVYFSDSSNNRIRRIDGQTGMVTTVAGNGDPGYNGDGIAATSAFISEPSAVLLDGADNIYFVDMGNEVVRRIDAVTGIITTVAGTPGSAGYTGDNGPATSATLSLPEGLAMDAAGNLYIADTANNVVRRVDAATHMITTYAGTGHAGSALGSGPATGAQLNQPRGLAIAPDGTLYIADLANNRVLHVNASGNISVVAGLGNPSYTGDGGLATQATLDAPASVAFDPAGDLYIGDSGNNVVREVTAATGIINTIAGGTTNVFLGDQGSALAASLYGPYSLFVDQQGNLLIADMFHNRVREIGATAFSIAYSAIRVSKTSAPVAEGLENDGNATLDVSSVALSNAALDPASTTCPTAAEGTLNQGTLCNLGVEFAPTVTGNPVDGTVTYASNAPNSPSVISLSGQVLSVNPATVTLTSSNNPSAIGTAVTFTATIVDPSDSNVGGTVTFLDGSTPLCNAASIANNVSTCSTSTLTLGTHSITASYTGDPENEANVSPVLSQIVRQTPNVGLTVTPNPAIITGTVTLTATVLAPSGTPTGAITFYDGSNALGSANLTSNGTASFTTSQLAAGAHSLTADYAGDTNDAPANSAAVSETVNLATTLTTISSTAATITVGNTVTLTATVTSTNGPQPTGSITFMSGTTQIGTATLSGGTASFSTSALAPGSYAIKAIYSGDTDNGTSTSSPLAETVQQIATQTQLTSTPNPANAGAEVEFTATVTVPASADSNTQARPQAAPVQQITGTVTFKDGATTLGTETLNASGVATLTLSTLSVATHNITATFNGNTDYAVSTSAPVAQVINQTTSTTALSLTGTGLAGEPLTLTATVASATGTPSGTVTFFDGTTSIGQATISAGVAVLKTSTLAVGSHSLSAHYGGDSNYGTSVSPAESESITLATPTLTLAGPTSAVNAGSPVPLNAALASSGMAPTGSLTLRDGGNTVTTQPVSKSGSFNFAPTTLAVGSHTLTVSYSGDANNALVVSNAVTVTVQQGSTSTSLQTSVNPQVLGQSLTLSATVSSPGPNITGNVSFYDGSTLLGSVAVGTNGAATFSTSTLTSGAHTLTAVYGGDTNHTSSTSPAVTQHIVEPVVIGVASSANPAISGASLTFTATLSGNSGTPPTGTVNFLDGGTLLATAPLSATGTATLNTSTLAVGTHVITVSYAGDSNYASGTSTALTQSIVNANTQVGLSANVNPATFGAPLTLQATVTSNGGVATGNVTFTDGSTPIGSAVLNASGAATLTLSTLSPGTHSLVANYAGSASASASVSAPLSLVVKQTSAVALASSANPSPTLSSITLTATVTNAGQDVPSGTITFTDGGTQLGTAPLNASGIATLTVPQLSAATHNIVASYAGDGNNFASTSSALSQVVQLRPTTTTLTASSQSGGDAQEMTLIAVVRWTGPNTPTGTVTFSDGNSVIGSAPVDSTGVATTTFELSSSSASLTATYMGDTAYATSVSPATTISPTGTEQFKMSLDPPSLTLQSKQHSTVTLTVSSPSTFADTLEYGCLGLPEAASCVFSTSSQQLKAGGTVSVQVTIDTGDPLGAGGSETAANHSGRNVLACFLPGTLLAGLLFFGKRKRAKFAALAVMMLAVTMMFATTGCGGLTVNGTPAGNYTFQVTARGVNTGISSSASMTLNVTQ